MITNKYRWKQRDGEPDASFLKLAKKENLTTEASRILFNRGIDTEEKLQAFLSADIFSLHDPYLLHDMGKSITRIRQAIEQGERILVYGDYDADGMTSASIVKEALETLGAEVIVYLPNRFTDGYGPNQSVYRYFIENEAISLILTVDNGVAGHEAISYAMEAGVDVIVTDHHSLPETLPDAFAIVHPEHPESAYPFQHLAGCGVAFKLATALLDAIPTEFLDLVAIGTIADMVSLTGENRIFVKYGLKVLRETDRVGLQELLKISSIPIPEITEETVGFQIAPQLNALGRLDDPNPAIELLTGFDDEEAHSIAQMIYDKNEERKMLVTRIYEEALEMVDETKPVQVLAKEGWHPGVLGIVAGRLLERLGQPVIVLEISSDRAKGSGRSTESVNLFKALDSHRDLFIAFGGHAGAAGMTLPVESIDSLSQVLCDYVTANEIDTTQKKELFLDGSLHLPDISLDAVKSLERLAPFGMDNPKPVFLISDFTVKQVRTMGQGSSHLKMKICQEQTDMDVIAFQLGEQAQAFQQAQHLSLATTLSVNQWNGQTTLQLLLEDAKVEGIQLIDIRGKNQELPSGIEILTTETTAREVVVMTIPEDESSLRSLFVGKTFDVIYFKNNIEKAYYLTGYGTRDQFAKLYKTIYQYPEFDVRYKLKPLSDYLKIPEILLIKMIQIFEELEFVTVTDGVMRVNKDADKRAIEESHIYQDLKKLVDFQERMALGTPQEIYDYLKQEETD